MTEPPGPGSPQAGSDSPQPTWAPRIAYVVLDLRFGPVFIRTLRFWRASGQPDRSILSSPTSDTARLGVARTHRPPSSEVVALVNPRRGAVRPRPSLAGHGWGTLFEYVGCPDQPLYACENLTNEGPRQVAFGKL